MGEKNECIFKELLERANNMPQPPLRYVHFLEDVSIDVALIEDSPIVFEKGEFVFVSESYGYPAGAMIVKDEIAFYLNEIDGRGTKFKVFVEEPSEIGEAV